MSLAMPSLAYDLPLPVLGRYTVELALDGTIMTTLPLTVAEAPGVAPPPPGR